MIFATVGTSKYPFPRLVKSVVKIAKKFPDEEFVIQSGIYEFEGLLPKNIYIKSFFSFEQIQKYVDLSYLVIGHCGFGTVVQCLMAGKRPLVLPRRKKYGEHVNDHQFSLYENLKEKKLILSVQEELVKVNKLLIDKNSFSLAKELNLL